MNDFYSAVGINVLLLDDEYSKTQAIIGVLSEMGVGPEMVKQVLTANDARKEMYVKKYDLLILDMNIPCTMGAPPTALGGIDLLKIMKIDSKIRTPSQIIGITARGDAFGQAEREMKAMSWTICMYDTASVEWSIILKEKIAHTQRTLSAGTEAALRHFDIVLVTALRSPEFDAVLNLPCAWREFTLPGDFTSYYEGVIESRAGPISVIAASSLRMGMPSAAALSIKMSIIFKPKVVAMVGICAGNQKSCNLGDIVVADPVWDWGSGKFKNINGEKSFAINPHQVGLEASYRSQIINFKDKGRLISDLRSAWNGSVPSGAIRVHVGPMASGASVVSDTDIMSEIEKQNRNTIAVEMEAYGVMAAVEYANIPAPKVIVMKSVCDFGDSAKHNEWQSYASYTSAMFFYLAFRDHLSI